MSSRWSWAGAAVMVATVAVWSCGGRSKPVSGAPAPPPPDAGAPADGGPGGGDAGTPAGDGGFDAGTPPGLDGGSDAGMPPGGTDGGTDGGLDGGGGSDGGVTTIIFPSADGWTFYGPQNGGPDDVRDVTSDQGGNLWVAGGEQGLFLLRTGSSTFERFTLADGLHPYGYMADGGDAPGPHYLKVISVAGGPPGTVFVGYAGRPPPPGALDCETNWDGPNPDPSIYKSGDADRVTLTGSGISVVHYDIFSGPNVVRAEPRGREKLCTILRIVYDLRTKSVWFGANHGFARGDPDFPGNRGCDGQLDCSGVLEHVHPALNAYASDDPSDFRYIYLTGDYYGVAPDPVTGDIWFGGANRTTRFHYATAGNYFDAEYQTEDRPYVSNRIDIWPDRVGEPDVPRPSDRVDDLVSGIAAMDDGTAWVGSFAHGLAHLDASGKVIGYVTGALPTPYVSAVAADPTDQSVWAGMRWGGGIARMQGGTTLQYSGATFGPTLTNSPISNIQMDQSTGKRRVLVGFGRNGSTPGVVGIYTGK